MDKNTGPMPTQLPIWEGYVGIRLLEIPRTQTIGTWMVEIWPKAVKIIFWAQIQWVRILDDYQTIKFGLVPVYGRNGITGGPDGLLPMDVSLGIILCVYV